MTTALYDSVSRIARHEAAARLTAAIAVVVDVFDSDATPADHCVTLQLRESGLVLPRVPIAVGTPGFAATPAPDDLVVVVFADGDVHAPVVIGSLYHAGLTPPAHAEGEVALRLPAGSDDPSFQAVLRGADPALTVQLRDDVEVHLDAGRIRLKAGDAAATIEAAGGGRTEITVGDVSFTITGSGNVEVRTPAKISLTGDQIELRAQTRISISAPQVAVN